jgi:integrase
LPYRTTLLFEASCGGITLKPAADANLIHPKVVSERLGHANVSITLDTYSHSIPAMQADAAERIAALVFD